MKNLIFFMFSNHSTKPGQILTKTLLTLFFRMKAFRGAAAGTGLCKGFTFSKGETFFC